MKDLMLGLGLPVLSIAGGDMRSEVVKVGPSDFGIAIGAGLP